MIFPREKLIFIPIPKTGTVSMATWLRQFMTPGYVTDMSQYARFGHPNHPTLEQCHEKIKAGGEDPSTYRSFAFIRNPWAHAYSMWQYLSKTERTKKDWNSWLGARANGWECCPRERVKNSDLGDWNFKGYLPRLLSKYRNVDYVGTLEYFDKHVNALKSFILNQHIDAYVKDFESDFPGFTATGLKARLEQPLHLNMTVADKQEYANKYTNEQKEIVRSLYANDIENFGYYFNGRKGED